MHTAQHSDSLEATVPISLQAAVSAQPEPKRPSTATIEETSYLELDLNIVSAATHTTAKDDGSNDPAVQALALAATRAEVNRLMRTQEELERAVRLRDGWLDTARAELKAAESEHRALAAQLREAKEQIQSMSGLCYRDVAGSVPFPVVGCQ